MIVTTSGLVFFGVVSTDVDVDTWRALLEQEGEGDDGQGLVFGRLRGETSTSYYLAVADSVKEVDAGSAKALVLPEMTLTPPWSWPPKLLGRARALGLPMPQGGPCWHLACSAGLITHEEIASLIDDHFDPLLTKGKTYPGQIPEALQPWYCYYEGGHSIVVAVKHLYRSGASSSSFLELAPVRTVLRGYEIRDGYILVDWPCTKQDGLVVPAEDREY